MIEFLINIDHNLFLWLNGFHNGYFDQIMLWVSHSRTWLPLYVFLIFLLFKKFGIKQGIIYILIIIVAVGCSDFITSGLMKPFFGRLRPCHNPEIMSQMHLVGNCGGQYGFVSSHASNSFALFFIISQIGIYKKYLKPAMLLWAIIVSYSRIYLGVHFPIDVFVGASIGICISFLIFEFYKKILSTIINS
ncbi:MAG: phosphatase PAP2 family protein [Cytophagaceae bacterium]|nr:phosphatase PAP2 family protein [Cytophagaceae bacterium]MBL0304073.1 phosphatase PAP2 family protein [Cytophagaceae bacterium]MBL0326883.1 phosphatase PAP2 family protein [Cytophagaceae bacterium]